ncbi:hypothetical protein CJP74_03720 [Psittacicella melopsittaci]|uniref:SprT-like domain-containing protein n=1 Tax=Psittacicella melopsittaci TaxID=2028576 RepID=A0A3A1Y3B4_9GAMM|nr:hypothetical protein [Psittacicella melopsittaci]RIY32723.1 hypothetical protein CJP74_03720 [Psittacicella melopsittaci]
MSTENFTPQMQKWLTNAQKVSQKFATFVRQACERKLNPPTKPWRNKEVVLVKLLQEYPVKDQGVHVAHWQQKVIKKCLEVYNLALDLFAFRQEFTFPKIEFHKHHTRSVGWFCPGDHTLSFHIFTIILEQQRYLDDVVPHEMAHVVQHYLYREKIIPRKYASGHDLVFQILAQMLGSTGKATFQISQEEQISQRLQSQQASLRQTLKNLEPKKGNYYHYHCACANKEHKLKIIRHNNIQKGKRQYICLKCKQTLKFTGQVTPISIFTSE